MKNAKRLASLVLVLVLVLSMALTANAAYNEKVDDFDDWHQGILNDLANGTRKNGQEPALTVLKSSQQKDGVVAPKAATNDEKMDTAEVEVKVETKTATKTATAPTSNTKPVNGELTDWQKGIIDDILSGNRVEKPSYTVTKG